MTSSAINDFNSMNYGAFTTGNSSKPSDPVEDMMTGFQDAMQMAKDQTFDGLSATYETSKTTDIFSTTKTESATYTSTKTTNSVKDQLDAKSQTDNVKKTELSDEQKDDMVKDVKEVTDKVVKTIAEKLGVSEEDVKQAMETLGLLLVDLLDSTNMTTLVAQVTGTEPVQMVLDGDFFNSIKDLMANVSDMIQTDLSALAADLGVDFEDLMNAIQEAFEDKMPQVDMAADLDVAVDMAAGSEVRANVVEVLGEVAEDDAVTEVEDATDVADGVDIVEANIKETTDDKAKTSDHSEEHSNFSNETGSNVSQINNPTQVNATTTEAMNMTSVQDAQELIDQIADYVKTRQSGELTEMEIKLNPETLGNLHLQVAAKDGVITAHITTENEAVREALMTQAMILKEELNEQGLKVEAVEVTVASHEFEQNMQQESGQQAQQLYEKELNKQTRRRLVIENLAQAQQMLEDDELSDADKLNIDMMTRSGNSMDIQA